MTHSIETILYVLPTYHKFDVIKSDDTEKTPPAISILSDTDYATKAKFMEAGPSYTKTFLYPQDESTIDTDLYRVENSTFDPDENPIVYELFSARTHVAPHVLWFQPYNKSSQNIELSLTIGLKIIQNELDGIIIPLPNINKDLTTNNSFYLQGSVQISEVNTFIPSEDANSILRLQKRRTHTRTSQPMRFSVRNSTINALPVLGNANVCTLTAQKIGFTPQSGFNDPREAGTIIPWTPGSPPPVRDSRFNIWSFYRHIDEDVYNETSNISFYASLRALTGTSVTLSRTPHPSRIIPS